MTERLAVIAHGWRSAPDKFWYPHTADLLRNAGFHVSIPRMPEARIPNLEEYLQTLREEIGDNRDVTLVTHSIS